MSTDTTPGTVDTMPLDLPGLPPEPPKPDEKPQPKRPTTRAGRQAAAQAKKIAGKAEKKPIAAKATPRRASLETRLTGSLVTLGTVVSVTGSMVSESVVADGALICAHAPNVAAALDKVAKDDPRVAAALEKMLTAGVWSGLIAAMLPLAIGVAANHGAIPEHLATMLGTAPAAPEPEHEPDNGGGIV